MTTTNNTLAPTDADIIALADKTRTGEPGREGYILPISFARAVLAKWGGSEAHPAAPAQAGEYPEPSPTAGMSIAQRILHVGGRNNAAGYVEFGSTQAVEALVCQVLRDRAATWRPIATAPIDGKKILLRSKRGRIADGLWSAANSSAGFWTWAYVCQEPIEWMPLPASPAAIAAQQGGANG